MQNNTIVVLQSNQVFIIDPSFDAEQIYKEYKGVEHKYVILTHCHYDHIGNLEALNQFADQIIMSDKVKDNKKKMLSDIFFATDKLAWDKVKFVHDKMTYKGFTFFQTPGHSIDSMCVLYGSVLASGDHIFYASIGRTDLATSDDQQMYQSILYFKQFIDAYRVEIVIPGHGQYLNVDLLKEVNPYLQVK